MSEELAFAVINPYTLRKARTGGILARLLSQPGLELIAARMFAPSERMVREYCAAIEPDPRSPYRETQELVRDYIRSQYPPDAKTGEPRRVVFLLFRGEGAVAILRDRVIGRITPSVITGETIRDIYGDCIRDEEGRVRYFEPAVEIIANGSDAAAKLRIWAKYSDSDGGFLKDVIRYGEGERVETTLVLLKPENFHAPSVRPGYVMDLFSRAGLCLVGMRVLCMSVAQAEKFYDPLWDVLRKKLKAGVIADLRSALESKFGFPPPEEVLAEIGDRMNEAVVAEQFGSIVRYMTGLDRGAVMTEEEKKAPGRERCLALAYQGVDAIGKIRSILGSTDPSRAAFMTVRKEFGHDVMVNAAHASDSEASSERELAIVDIGANDVKPLIEEHLL